MAMTPIKQPRLVSCLKCAELCYRVRFYAFMGYVCERCFRGL